MIELVEFIFREWGVWPRCGWMAWAAIAVLILIFFLAWRKTAIFVFGRVGPVIFGQISTAWLQYRRSGGQQGCMLPSVVWQRFEEFYG